MTQRGFSIAAGRRTCRSRPSAAGFSLIEGLIVIAIISLVAALGVPALLQHLARLRLESTANDIALLMQQTRLRAIRDHATYTVGVNGVKVEGKGLIDDVEIEFLDPRIQLYNNTGAADCWDRYDGSGVPWDGDTVDYSHDGTASATLAICVHDGRDNVLQVVLQYPAGQPKIRKYLPAADAPAGAGFYERTSFNADTTTASIWVWYY